MSAAPLVERYLHGLDGQEDELIAARRDLAALDPERAVQPLRLDRGRRLELAELWADGTN